MGAWATCSNLSVGPPLVYIVPTNREMTGWGRFLTPVKHAVILYEYVSRLHPGTIRSLEFSSWYVIRYVKITHVKKNYTVSVYKLNSFDLQFILVFLFLREKQYVRFATLTDELQSYLLI